MIRLKEIGRADVAEKLSRTVYHEKAEEVRHEFLEDPFKDFIKQDSQLLEEAPQRVPTGRPPPATDSWSAAAIFGLVFLFLVASGLVIGLVALNCPEMCNYRICEVIGRKTLGIPDDVTFDGKGRASLHEIQV